MAERPEDDAVDEPVTGMPEGEPESPPLGVPEADPDGKATGHGDDAMPGIPTQGEPPSGG